MILYCHLVLEEILIICTYKLSIITSVKINNQNNQIFGFINQASFSFQQLVFTLSLVPCTMTCILLSELFNMYNDINCVKL